MGMMPTTTVIIDDHAHCCGFAVYNRFKYGKICHGIFLGFIIATIGMIIGAVVLAGERFTDNKDPVLLGIASLDRPKYVDLVI